MYYDSIEDWLDANTKEAYKIAESIAKEDDKEELLLTLDWLKEEIISRNNVGNWLDSAIDDVVDEETKCQIVKMFTMRMHNYYVTNTEIGQEMFKKGWIKPAGFTTLWEVGDDNE